MTQHRLSFRTFERTRLGTLLLMGFHGLGVLFWLSLRALSQGKLDPAVAPYLQIGTLLFIVMSALQFVICLRRLIGGKTVG